MFPRVDSDADRERFQSELRQLWSIARADPTTTNTAAVLTQRRERELVVEGQLLADTQLALSLSAQTKCTHTHTQGVSLSLLDGYGLYLRPVGVNVCAEDELIFTATHTHTNNDSKSNNLNDCNRSPAHGSVSVRVSQSQLKHWQCCVDEDKDKISADICTDTHTDTHTHRDTEALRALLETEISEECIHSLRAPAERLREIARYYTSEEYLSLRAQLLARDPSLAHTPSNVYRRKIVDKIIEMYGEKGT